VSTAGDDAELQEADDTERYLLDAMCSPTPQFERCLGTDFCATAPTTSSPPDLRRHAALAVQLAEERQPPATADHAMGRVDRRACSF
jgi:hypothetical protein